MNILILSAGSSHGAGDDDYPSCLTEVNGIPLLQRLVSESAGLKPEKIIFAFQQAQIDKFHLDHVAQRLTDRAEIFGVSERTQGAACTILSGVHHIDDDQELLIMNANELVRADLVEIVQSFRDRKLAAGTITFPSVHPRYSYVRLDPTGLVTEAAEKNPISNNATGGVYWFINGALFVQCAMSMIRKDARVNDKFYICPVFNEIILKGLKVGVFSINNDQYIPLKNDRQLEAYEVNAGRGSV